MELTDKEARAIKFIYDSYNLGIKSADEALENLEQLINNGDNEWD